MAWIIPQSAYSKKKETIHKTRLPTKNKTPNLKCFICGFRPAKRFVISEKEVRILCAVHENNFLQKDEKNTVNFVRGSKLV